MSVEGLVIEKHLRMTMLTGTRTHWIPIDIYREILRCQLQVDKSVSRRPTSFILQNQDTYDSHVSYMFILSFSHRDPSAQKPDSKIFK
ncbi:hypothetical protein ABKN59_003909 [Abortiporus biennis]